MRRLLMTGVLLLASGLAGAAETKLDPKAQEALEMHRKMAESHRKAAECIEAGKPLKECHHEAMKGCPMAESGHCPFMGGGMKKGRMKRMHEGMHHHGMMEGEGGKPAAGD